MKQHLDMWLNTNILNAFSFNIFLEFFLEEQFCN